MESDDLTIIIVSFKSEKIIDKCLNTIPKKTKIILVENSNNKEFKKKLEKNYKNLKCLLTGENKGYATANNLGLSKVKTKYALVLNPDTILDKNAIKNFLLRAHQNPEFSLIGPANDQMVNLKFNDDNFLEVENIKGFAIFFNMKKFNNFFDENYFLYFEEIDLCKRVKRNFGKIYLDKNIKIFHQGANSVDTINYLNLEKNRNWHWMWSSFYFHKKFKGFFLAFIIILPKIFSSLIKTLIYCLIFNIKKRDIYYCRLSGIFNSLLGKKSWYRPSLD